MLEYVATDKPQWCYTKPPYTPDTKLQLLTIGGMCVTGNWRGRVGEYFLAWAPLLKRDKQVEREILQGEKNV